MERKNILLLAATGAIALGLISADALTLVFIAPVLAPRYDLWLAIIPWALLFSSPVIPFMLAATHVFGGFRLHRRLASSLYPMIALPGALLTLAFAAVSDASSTLLPLAHGMTLTFGLASSVLLVSTAGSEETRLLLGWMPMLSAGIAGLWSILVAALVLLSSSLIAGDKPFCVALDGARHEREHERMSVARMRGFSFYTLSQERIGVIRSFHAVLVLEGDAPYSHNWSFAQYRFVPTGFDTADMARCTPKPQYWSTVPLFSFSLPPDRAPKN
ncbi:hypothetical protein [Sinorhizobium meliloti]|uniref:hypothetical protein n=1 Tax=Rhizobium meliloti TaxID=382 RepID=UPI00067F6E7C|nr:hypothetical protein [Sinorhizobium meliloti]UFX10023.1 hypothetical protein SmelRRI128_08920 [Sinorhizobium meliloti]